MNQPLVSIISPVYNHEHYIREGIQSIIDQTYPHIELIVINDGSTDKSDEAIEAITPACEERFHRFLHVSRPNKGLVKTLNEAISHCNGTYLATLPSDDSHYPKSIETLLNFLEKNSNYCLAVGDNTLINDEGTPIFWDKRKQETLDEKAPYRTFGDFLKSNRDDIDFHSPDFGSYASLLKGNYIPNGYLMRLETLKHIQGYSNDSPLEDHFLMLNLAKHGLMKYIDKPLYNYRWHATNMIKGIPGIKKKLLTNILLEEDYCRQNPELLALWLKQCNEFKERKGLAKALFKMRRAFNL